MKQIYIIRHAKSSWKELNMKDIDRSLNKRGLHDAPKMAQQLFDRTHGELDLIYSSPANRALTTAKEFHSKFKFENDIDIRNDIYHGDMEDVIHIIKETDEIHDTIAIFGHNPTFTYLLNYLASANIDNLPTCGIAILSFNSDKWSNLDPSKIVLTELMLPKKLLY